VKLLDRFTSPSTRRLTQAVRDGVGVREQTWELAAPRDGGTAALVAEIVEWARESMAGMRRPYGIDHVAVALACRDARGRVVCSSALGVMRPTVFYTDEGSERVAAFLADVRFANPGEGAQVVGALLSLGDVAYEIGLEARPA
jgi:hypothetical protein